MRKAKVYRNGSLTPAKYVGELAEVSSRMDSAKPAGHPGRMGSLYAAPTLRAGLRWTRANLSSYSPSASPDLETYELTVDADAVFVYSIEEWERYSNGWGRAAVEAEGYWASGMTLAAFLDRLETDGDLQPEEWELLLAPADVISTRRVSRKRLLEAAEGWIFQNDLAFALKYHRIR